MLLRLGHRETLYFFLITQATDWDHWMGTELVHQGREVVIPEVPRSAHLGVLGAHSQGSQGKRAFLSRAFSHNTDVHLNVTM